MSRRSAVQDLRPYPKGCFFSSILNPNSGNSVGFDKTLITSELIHALFLALRSIGYPAGMAEGSVSLEVRTPALTLMHLPPKGRSPYESLLRSLRASWRQAFGILEHQTRSRECPHSKVIEFAPLGAQLPQLAPAGNCVDVLWFRSKRLCNRTLKHRYLDAKLDFHFRFKCLQKP